MAGLSPDRPAQNTKTMYEQKLKGYLVYFTGKLEYGTMTYHEGGEVTVNGVRQPISADTPSFCDTAQNAKEYLQHLAKVKYEIINRLKNEAATAQGNAFRLERELQEPYKP